MKFGIKLWSINTALFDSAIREFNNKKFDYIEIKAITGTFNKKLLSKLKKIPTIVHIDNKVNFAQKSFLKRNLEAIKAAQKFADYLGSKYIIVHPGHNGKINQVNKTLRVINDNRICVENMPGKTFDLKYRCVGRNFQELKQIKTKNYCLDFAHAVKAAITLKKDIKGFIKKLLKLNPVIFHISDGLMDEVDKHLSLG